MKEYNNIGVRYWKDTFKEFKPFDIVSYDTVVDAYLENNSDLKGKYDEFGWNNRPINSDKEELKEGEFWNGFSPTYYNISPIKDGFTMAKADVISMDMKGLGRAWSHFVYLELPFELINEYMTNLHDNEDVSKLREYIDTVEKTEQGWTKENYQKIENEFDQKYPETSSYTDYFETHTCIKWKQDFDILQYISLKEKGLLYPICYNSSYHILDRGTHRAVLLAKSGSDIPFFIQYPGLDLTSKKDITLHTPPYFKGRELKIVVNFEKKELTFYIEENLLGNLKYSL